MSITVPLEGFGGGRLPTPEEIGALSMELLWENASPASNFPTQSVAVNASQYTMLCVEYAVQKEYPYAISTFAKYVEGGTLAAHFQWGGNGEYGHRSAIMTPSLLEFAPASANGLLSGQDNWIIPIRIYGIKGVSA